MGLSPFGGSSSCGCSGPAGPSYSTMAKYLGPAASHTTNQASICGNPNPRNFEVLTLDQITPDWCMARVKYPDAKNFEGEKIMLYRAKVHQVAGATVLDPHFCDNPTCLSPFARFEPTAAGWRAGVALAHVMQKTEDVLGEGNG